ncbi:MAG: 1,4-dihydroxy-6-naphthoate synthase [Lewinellaceae bacterium]|nr:1,4-dihydroxy-6-naphthoate synthase [Saprospiraceae bacterium]MCB9331618.1 1,4-dihydroxy-6-naphthoate synthase [Lewinellaceae bacterium]
MLNLCFSPCPNDTFIFDAMIHGKVDTEGLAFDVVLDDVEALNRRAFAGQADITKLSYHAFAYLTDKFDLLDAGSALGTNCGPLLIAREPITDATLQDGPIAIPGKMTTANFLLSLAYPEARNKPEYLFSDIEDAVERGEVVAGLIIHENRFTYQKRGLVKLLDLGEYWETLTGMPIPLGGIVVRKDLPKDVKQTINRVLRRSVDYAKAHPELVMPYVRQHAQAMEDAVMQAHIDLYVTDYTADLGAKGRETVQQMFQLALEKQIIPNYNKFFFIN